MTKEEFREEVVSKVFLNIFWNKLAHEKELIKNYFINPKKMANKNFEALNNYVIDTSNFIMKEHDVTNVNIININIVNIIESVDWLDVVFSIKLYKGNELLYKLDNRVVQTLIVQTNENIL